MRKYTTILLDVDGTLLDFKAAERESIRTCFHLFDLGECTDEMIAEYSAINDIFWQRLERGELTKQEVLTGRFVEFFKCRGLDVEKAPAFGDAYESHLPDTIVYRDDSLNLVKSLKGKVRLCAVTNGTKAVQDKKLKVSGFEELFDDIFISDEVGFEKPSKKFFDVVMETVKAPAEEMLIVGDSLTSDIKGGNNAGIATCWYNPGNKDNNIGVHVDYEIGHLSELLPIIQG